LTLKRILKALIYCRVSTDEQARSGFSLAQQREALRAYCKGEGIEIVAEFEDRASGASLDRPGLDALRDVVSSGGIDLVLAQDRDRFSREPAYHYLLSKEFEEYGCKMRSLNDRGDDSPEGELTDGILDQLAKYERAKTAERTRRGKLQKARSGKVVGNGTAPLGFFYSGGHLHIDPERMSTVREIFERTAAGYSLRSTVQHLTRIGAPTAKGGKWRHSTLRKIIWGDVYLGTFYHGRERVTTTNVSVVEDGKKVYKRKTVTEKRPPSEWIAVPVPPSGIPPETVARAREVLKGNVKSVSKNDGRTWELSGGVAVCAECGRNMTTYTTFNQTKKIYHYYRCTNREHRACSNTKSHGAERLEKTVMDAVANTFQADTWGTFVDDVCRRKLDDLRRLGIADPAKSRERLAGRIVALETKITRARDLFIDGDLPRPDYEEKKSLLQDEIGLVQKELSKIAALDDEVKRVEDLRRLLLSMENPLSGHYVYTDEAPVGMKDSMIDYGFGYGSKVTAAKRRQEVYRRVGMKVRVGDGLEICLNTGEPIVSDLGTASEDCATIISSTWRTGILGICVTTVADNRRREWR